MGTPARFDSATHRRRPTVDFNYSPQFIDDETVRANRISWAAQWEKFTKYLESKGKLRK
jgi:hypothetical protein